MVDWTIHPGPGSRRISVPSRLSHNPPEASNWVDVIILAPPVPRKVMVSGGGLFSSIVIVTIK